MLASAACSVVPAGSFADCVPSPSRYTRCKRGRDIFEKANRPEKDEMPKFMNLRSRKRSNTNFAADSQSSQTRTTSTSGKKWKGPETCTHDKRKSQCKECKGSQICFHGRRKHQCKDCKGSQICVHERRKHQCKECKGSQICEHDRRKHQCKDCRESRNKFTDYARKYQPSTRGLDSKRVIVKVEPPSRDEAIGRMQKPRELSKDKKEAPRTHSMDPLIYPLQTETNINRSSPPHSDSIIAPDHADPSCNLFLLASVVCTSVHEDGHGPS
jgi:hypothetical protein